MWWTSGFHLLMVHMAASRMPHAEVSKLFHFVFFKRKTLGKATVFLKMKNPEWIQHYSEDILKNAEENDSKSPPQQVNLCDAWGRHPMENPQQGDKIITGTWVRHERQTSIWNDMVKAGTAVGSSQQQLCMGARSCSPGLTRQKATDSAGLRESCSGLLGASSL